MRISRLCLVILLSSCFLLIVAGCATGQPMLGGKSRLPEFMKYASPEAREAYEYAAAHPDELKNYPCYCGCANIGHKDNLACYIKAIMPDSRIEYDNHAVGCGICVDITRDAMRLKREGQSSRQIRAYIDAKYSQFGPSTDTPLPND